MSRLAVFHESGLARPKFCTGVEGARRRYEEERDRAALLLGARSDSEIIRAAMGYCEHGWQVLVLEPGGKRPAGPSAGVASASARPSVVLSRLDAVPEANVGIRTGEVSGLIGIDIDGEVGEASWRLLWESSAEPVTLTALSGRDDGGRHLYFRLDSGLELRAGNNALGSGIDVKLDNGYLVAPPSLHETGRTYEWLDPLVPILDLPIRLRELLAKGANRPDSSVEAPEKPRVSPTLCETDTRWGLAAIQGIAEALATCPPGGGSRGGRDNLANWSYHRAGRIVAGEQLSESTALRMLEEALDLNGLGRGAAKLPAFDAGLQLPVTPEEKGDAAEEAGENSTPSGGVVPVSEPESEQQERPSREPPYTATALTASELVSMWGNTKTYSDIQFDPPPAHHWLAGEAPDYWCNPDGLSLLLSQVDLPDCWFNGHVVLRNKSAPEYANFAAHGQANRAPRFRVTRNCQPLNSGLVRCHRAILAPRREH